MTGDSLMRRSRGTRCSITWNRLKTFTRSYCEHRDVSDDGQEKNSAAEQRKEKRVEEQSKDTQNRSHGNLSISGKIPNQLDRL